MTLMSLVLKEWVLYRLPLGGLNFTGIPTCGMNEGKSFIGWESEYRI
jgi:hypothetical protein